MTNKFNVGDKVRILNEVDSQFKKGTIGIIKGCDHSGYREWEVLVNGDSEWFDPEEIELVGSQFTNNQRITKLEEEVAELKLIVAQIRKPSTVVEEALQGADYSTQPDETILTFEGKQYKKVDREAQINDVVIFRVNETHKDFSVTNKPYLVSCLEGDRPRFIGGCKTEFYVYADDHKRTPENVDVYELINYAQASTPESIAEWESKTKTANQLRVEIIEKAKAFVERNSQGIHYDVPVIVNNLKTFITLAVHFGASDELEFVINNEKRTVVALIRTVTGKRLFHRGIAKCDPSDVFNEHIGKAIALGRALGLDVSEFEQAVQPDEILAGMHVFYKKEDRYAITIHDDIKGIKIFSETYLSTAKGQFKQGNCQIINDTNAQYEVNK